MRLPLIATLYLPLVLVLASCGGQHDSQTENPPRIIAVLPQQDHYPVGQMIGIMTEKDCAECTILFEDKEVPIAGYYTLTLPPDEVAPKTEALETTVGPGVILPDIVTGCPSNNNIGNGCVVFVRVVQKGMKSNQRAVLVVPVGGEEAAPAGTPDLLSPQLTAPLVQPVSPVIVSPTTTPAAGTAIPTNNQTTTIVTAGQTTSGTIARPPSEAKEDDETPTPPEAPESPPVDEGDGSTSGDDETPPRPPPRGPEDFSLFPPLQNPEIDRIPGRIPPPGGLAGDNADVDDEPPSTACPYDEKRSDALVRNLTLFLSSAVPILRVDRLPVMQFTFCDRLPVNSDCSRIVIDPARDRIEQIRQQFFVVAIRETRALTRESYGADKIPLSRLTYLRLSLLDRSPVREIVLDDLVVEARVDGFPPIRVHDQSNLNEKLLLDRSTIDAEIDFDSGCVATGSSKVPDKSTDEKEKDPGKGDSTPSTKVTAQPTDPARNIEDIRIKVTPLSGRAPEIYPLMHARFCPSEMYNTRHCHEFNIDPEPNPDISRPLFTGQGLEASFSYGLVEARAGDRSNIIFPKDLGHLRFSLVDAGIYRARSIEMRSLMIEVRVENEAGWHQCDDIFKRNLQRHRLATRSNRVPFLVDFELECSE